MPGTLPDDVTQNMIDAHHDGSAYGYEAAPQPTQEDEQAEAWEFWHQRCLMLENATSRCAAELLHAAQLLEPRFPSVSFKMRAMANDALAKAAWRRS